MNSALTPEKRPDKNGKLVTRHVKTGGSDSASGRSIPAPSTVLKEKTVEQTASELLDVLENGTGNAKLDSAYRKWYLGELKNLPSTNALDLAMECVSTPVGAEWVPAFIKEATNRNMEGHELDRLLTVYFSGVEIHEKMREYSPIYGYSNAEQTLTAMYTTMGFAKMKEYDGSLTDDHIKYVKSQVVLEMSGVKSHNFALPHEYYGILSKVKDNIDLIERNAVVLSASEVNKYDTHFGDEMVRISSAVDESGYDPEDVAKFMKERDIRNAERALEMMSTSAQSLSSGVL